MIIKLGFTLTLLDVTPTLTSMVIKGYKRPLVQEDMWELNDVDSTAYISQRFQYFMQSNLDAARVRLQKKKNSEKTQEEAFQNGLSNGLGKGISQDVLMMVSVMKKQNTSVYSRYSCTPNGFYV